MEWVEEFLITRKKQGLLRELRPLSYRRDGKIRVDGKEYIDFSSNDYLGLSNHPALREAAKRAVEEFGLSSSASRLMSGSIILHHQLEEKVALFKKKEKALVYSTGYQANIGIISSLVGRGDCVFADRLVHASILDGILLSGAKIFRFRHNDPDHLELLLKKHRHSFKKALIVTETVFSMEGDKCPLRELVALKERYGLLLMVDEAHATGIFGKRGTGVVEEEGFEEEIDLIMGTFGKALGGFGAYVASSKKLIHYLINTSRPFIYSTALPPPVVAGNLAALDIIEKEPYRRKELLRKVESFRKSLIQNGLKVKGSSQIVPLIVEGVESAGRLSELLQESGYWALPIRPPTVPKGEERIRFSICLFHTQETLRRLLTDILNIVQKFSIK